MEGSLEKKNSLECAADVQLGDVVDHIVAGANSASARDVRGRSLTPGGDPQTHRWSPRWTGVDRSQSRTQRSPASQCQAEPPMRRTAKEGRTDGKSGRRAVRPESSMERSWREAERGERRESEARRACRSPGLLSRSSLRRALRSLRENNRRGYEKTCNSRYCKVY